jgi:tRNA pseudouridine55 synthase
MPPVFSALKIGGRRACDRTRDGQTVELQPRKVRVHGIQILDYDFPRLRVLIDCGRGTYVRSMARDIAAALGTVGYLTALRRTAVGPCHIDQSTSLNLLLTNGPEKYLLPPPEI